MLQSLQHLVAEAAALGGGHLCASGHDWHTEGGRSCPHDEDCCGQSVYRCSRCGEYDYGDIGGPAAHDCATTCQLGHRARFAKAAAQAERERGE